MFSRTSEFPPLKFDPANTWSPATKADLYYRAANLLAESPVWADDMLYWTDIIGRAIYAKPDSLAAAHRFEVAVEIGSFALWESGRMVVATHKGFQSLNLEDCRLTPWQNPEASRQENRFNDGKCDPVGRFLAGTMNRIGRPGQGALYSAESERSIWKSYGPVSCSNGLAWSEDGQTLFYIDTPTQTVRAFLYDLETGRLSEERVVIEIPEVAGKPDGMTIDRDGNLWIALWGGWGVECWSPRSGRRIARIDVPVKCPTSCVFGGAGHEALFITSARQSHETGEPRQDLEGSLFWARPGSAGFPVVRFKSR